MVGESIGNYRIIARLGEGGMGTVYLGEHRRIARKVAIKVLLPELSRNEQMLARFFDEARATSLIRHPGIVDVTDCDLLPNGSAYIVMELLEGESLGSHLRRGGRLSRERALQLARHIADALAAAHDQGIVHRDLKPDNVFMLAGAGPAGQPLKILDFGIAKLLRPDSARQRTQTGSLLGTPAYMSPEQCRGVGNLDHRTDIYSLGCILFEMLCGRPPFESEGFGELIQWHLSSEPPSVRSLDPEAPAAVDALVARMLAKSAGDRPQTMRAVVAELDAIAGGGGVAAAVVPAPVPATVEPVESSSNARAERPMPRTLLLPPDAGQPRAQTTLRSASAERVVAPDAGGEPRVAKRRPWPIVGAAAAAVLLVGGIAIWRSGGARPAEPAPAAPVHAEAEPARVPVAAPAPVPTPAASPPPPVAPPAPVPAVAPPGEPPPAAAPEKVTVVIATEPSGADVCLARDRLLIGKTRLEWTQDRSERTAKLMIRKPGYRGQELTVGLDHDGKKHVKLDKLGPDDMDDVDNCTRK